MEAREVYCPKCQTVCPASNININALMAKCDYCDSIFALPVDEDSQNRKEGFPPSRPERIQRIDDLDSGLKLEWRWWSWLAIPLSLFCLIWDGFLVVWYSIAFSQMKPGNLEFYFMTLFPLGHVAAGMGMTYYTLALMVNRTTVRIDRGILSVRQGPLQWRSPPDVETSEIRGFELEPAWNNYQSQMSGWGSQYQLAIQDRNGTQRVLLRMLPAADARYLAYELAEFLNVPWRENVTSVGGTRILDQMRSAMNRGSRNK